MRLTSTLALTLVSMLPLIGCGPSLRADKHWNSRTVRAALFHDVCRLQSYFQRSSQPKPTSDTVINNSGEATYHLSGAEAAALALLVQRFYVDVPAMRGQVTAHVQYHLKGAHRTIPVGANTDVDIDGRSFSLPYHPCVGAFFFGEQRYHARRELLRRGGSLAVR